MLCIIHLQKEAWPKYSIWTYLIGFVEEEAEVGEDDPELLPAVAVLELAQQEAAQLVLKQPDQNHLFSGGRNLQWGIKH